MRNRHFTLGEFWIIFWSWQVNSKRSKLQDFWIVQFLLQSLLFLWRHLEEVSSPTNFFNHRWLSNYFVSLLTFVWHSSSVFSHLKSLRPVSYETSSFQESCFDYYLLSKRDFVLIIFSNFWKPQKQLWGRNWDETNPSLSSNARLLLRHKVKIFLFFSFAPCPRTCERILLP